MSYKKKIITLAVFLFVTMSIGCGNLAYSGTKGGKTKYQDVKTDVVEANSERGVNLISENEEMSMKLYINDKEIPVKWEENDSVNEIAEEASKNDITVEMSMYSDNEQVGSLGKKYSSSDVQTTTHNGDIVLYNSSNIVVFYGSNSWAYTRLGKMELSEQEVVEMLSNGNVTIKITSVQ